MTRKDLIETKSEWKDIAAEMRTTLKKNKRMQELLEKVVDLFEHIDMAKIARDAQEEKCEQCSGLDKLVDVVEKIQSRAD